MLLTLFYPLTFARVIYPSPPPTPATKTLSKEQQTLQLLIFTQVVVCFLKEKQVNREEVETGRSNSGSERD